MDVLHILDRMREVFQEPPIVAFRRDKNLCDTLYHSKTNAGLKPANFTCKQECGTVDYCQEMLSTILLTGLRASQLRILHATSEMWYMEYYVPGVRRLCM